MAKRKAKAQKVIDVFETEDLGSEDEEKHNPRYDHVANYQYELPENFEDEEIDEDEAFNEKDEEVYGHIFGGITVADQDEDEANEADVELTRDDFSDDDSEADRLYGRPESRKRQRAGKRSTNAESSELDEIFGQDRSEDDSESEDDDPDAEEVARIQQVVNEVVQPPKKKRQKSQARLKDEALPESEYNLSIGEVLKKPNGISEVKATSELDDTQPGDLTLADLLAGLGTKSGKLTKAEKQLAQLAKASKPVDAPLPRPIRARKERQVGYDETKKDVTKWQPIVQANREAPTLVFTGPTNDVGQTNTTAALTAKFQPKSTMEAEVAQLLKAAGIQDEESAAKAEEALALQEVSAEEFEKRQNELAKMRSLLYKHESKAKHLAKIKSKDYHQRLKKTAKAKAEKLGQMDDKDFIRLQAEQAEYDRAKERLTLKHKNTSQWARRALKRGVTEHADGKKEAIAEQLRLGEELRKRVDKADSVEASDSDDSAAPRGDSDDSDLEEGDEEGTARDQRKSQRLRSFANDIINDEDVDVSKGLFSLPFMKRAAEKQKAAAQSHARELLAELDGVTNDEDAPKSGRRNFGLEGGTQVGDDVLSDDEPVQSDEDEDVDTKRERLKNALQEERRLERHNLDDERDGRRESAGQSIAKHSAVVANGEANSSSDSEEGWGLGKTTFPSVSTNGRVRVAGGSLPSPSRQIDEQSMKEDESSKDVDHLPRPSRNSIDTAYLLKGRKRTEQTPKETPQVNGYTGSKHVVSVGPAKQPLQQPSLALGQAAEAELDDSAPDTAAEFQPSKRFTGSKSGYMFSSGPQGVGYYLDQSAVPAARLESQGKSQRTKANRKRSAAKEKAEAMESAVAEAATQVFGGVPDDGDAEPDGMSQRALIAEAFAGDDVVAEFQAAKDEEAGRELPKIEAPSLLPGWGTWAGKQKEPQWMIAEKAKVERQKKAALEGRRDAKLQNVVISERYDKKAAKFNVASLPFPYTSKAAFEGNMRQPLGAEFNTQTSFRHMTRPAILKSTGVIIKPLRYNQQSAEDSRQVQSTKNQDRPAVAKISGGLSMAMKSRKGLT